MRRALLIALLIHAACLLAVAQPATAAKWLLAEEKDKNIRKVLEPLLPSAVEQFERHDSDLVVVFDQRQFDIDSSSYDDYQNSVWWVARGEAEEITNYVRDFRPGVEIEKVRAFRIRLGALDPSRLREAEVEELSQDRIHIQPGNDEGRYTNLVVAFDAAEPGDLVGISIQLKVNEGFRWRTWHLADEWPVTRSELRLKSEWYLAYNIFGYGVPKGTMHKKILDESGGHVKDIRLWVDGTEPIVFEPYAPPPAHQSPSLTVLRWGERVRIDERNYMWWYLKDWNQVAVQMAGARDHALSQRSRVGTAPVARNAGPKEAAASWYHLLRDEMLDVSAWVHADQAPTVDDVFEFRTGDAEEKAYAFVALLHRYGLDPDVLWAHDPEFGRFFESYPAWGQINIPLVRVVFDDEVLWYDLGCGTCAPGEIRPGLRNSRALYYQQDTAEKHEAFMEAVIDRAYRKELDLPVVYLDMIDDEHWCEWVLTPGQMANVPAHTRVTRVFGTGAGDPGRIHLESSGPTDLRQRAHEDRDSAAAVSDWMAARFQDVERMDVVESSDLGADTLRVSVEVECAPLPPVAGEVWVLPADLVNGEPAVQAWPAKRLSPFHIGSDIIREWEVRFPLPEGWEDTLVPPDEVVGMGVLRYARTISVEGGELIVRRSLEERKCQISDPQALDLLGKQVQTIHELETTPLVLRRAGS